MSSPSNLRRHGACHAALFVFLLLLISANSPLRAQRIISTVNPQAQGMDLKFDINSETADNVAPNILFTSTGSHGLVAYAGSGTVVAFTPADGKIVASVKTGGRPSQIALAPDGSQLLAVDVFTNRIYSIDMGTFTVKATFTFPDAEFGFGNNIVFSADGKTAYISTARFDTKFQLHIDGELIRFNVADGKEAGARLKTERGPAVMTLSPDKTTLAVVNTVSNTVSVVDLAAFNVRAAAKFDAGTDLTFVNNVTFSADGSVGVVSNRGAASQFLTADVAFVFKTTNGEIVARPTAGILPLGSYLSPDGKFFYLLNLFGFNIVDAKTYELLQTVQTPFGQFQSNSNIVFRADSSVGFLASPDSDVLMSFRVATGGVESALPVSSDTTTNRQSLQVAVTPNGAITCALNFKENTLTCVVDTFDMSFPDLEASNYNFFGISLINTSREAVPFRLDAVDLNSVRFSDDAVGLDTGQDQLVALTGTGKLAQSFQLASDASIGLVKAHLKKTGSFTTSALIRATLQTDSSGVPSGTVVEDASVDIAADSVGTSLGFVNLRFSKKVSLAATTTYWLVLEGIGSYGSEYTAGSKVIDWGVDGSTPPFTNGQFSAFVTAWTADAGKDALFIVVLSEVNNPRELTLQPGQQFVATQDSFGLDDRERNGRVLVSAEKPGLKGYWIQGTRDLIRADGELPQVPGYTDIVLPEVVQIGDLQTGFSTEQDSQVALTGTGKLAQSFQLDSPAQINLVRVFLKKTGTFTSAANLRFSIQSDVSGVPSGTALDNATVEIGAESVFLVLSFINMRFDNPVSLQPATTYWLVLEGSGTYGSEFAAASTLIEWGVDGTSPAYTQGQFATFTTSWTADAAKDALFSIILAEQFNLNARYNIINRNFNFNTASFELVDADGSSVSQQTTNLPGLVRLVGGFEQIFSPGLPDRQGGYLRIRSAASIQAFEEFGTETSAGILPAIPVDAEALANSKLYFPHFASAPNIETQLNVINLSRETGFVTGQDAFVALTATGKLAQSFQLDEAANVSLLRLPLKKTGTFTEAAKLLVTFQGDASGSPSGTPLGSASAEINADSVGTSLSVVNFRFNKSVSLQPATTYWIVLEGSGAYQSEFAASTKIIEWGVDASNPTFTRGQFSVFTTSWAADSGKDGLFEIVLSEDNELTISLFSKQGVLLAPPLKKTVPAGGQLRELVSVLFPTLDYSRGQEGWIQVESSKPGIVGDVLFSNIPVDFITAGLLQAKPISNTLFAQVAHGAGFETGWALLNAGDLPADVTIDVYDTTGTLRGTHTMRLNSKASFAAYFGDLFQQIPELLGGYVVVRSTQPLFSFSIFNNSTFSFIAMIPPQPL